MWSAGKEAEVRLVSIIFLIYLLRHQLLTLYASGEDPRPRYGEAIVIKLQFLHQRNIILVPTHTHAPTQQSEILWVTPPPPPFSEGETHNTCPLPSP